MSSEPGRLGTGTLFRFRWFVVTVALATFVLYREFILDPASLIYGSDMFFEGISMRRFYIDELKAGNGVPLWLPHLFGGLPYVGLLPGPIFYPTTPLYLFLPLERAIGWTFVFHTFVGGASAYFLARSFRLRPASAWVTGTTFALTGYLTSHVFGGQDGRMFTMVLIPLALGLLNRGLETGRFKWFCLLALVIAAQAFTPHVQLMYFSSLALSLFFVFHLLFRVRRDPGESWVGAYWRPVLGFSIAVAGSIAISGPQLFPSLALLPHATRAATETGYAFAASWALPPQELTSFFLPDLIGSLPGLYWGANPLKLHTEHLGAIPIAFAILGVGGAVARVLPREGRKVVAFLVTASVLGVAFALGEATPVHRIAWSLVPLIGDLRAPAMMLGPVSVFVTLLAGYGWESVLAARRSGARLPTAGRLTMVLLGAPLLLLGLWAALDPDGLQRFVRLSWYPQGWPRSPTPELSSALRGTALFLLVGFAGAWGVGWGVARRRLGEVALLGVLVFGLLDSGRIDGRYVQVENSPAVLEADPVVSWLKENTEPGERVWAPRLGATPNYRPNELLYHGVTVAGGLQKFVLDPYARLLGGIFPDEGLVQRPVTRDLLNVRYVILTEPQDGAQTLAESGNRFLYRLPARAPYAWFPDSVQATTDTASALVATLGIPNPAELGIVETARGEQVPMAGQGSATLVDYSPGRIELSVNAERAGVLAVSEVHHPGWTARVSGVAPGAEGAGEATTATTRIWRVNTAFQGIEVPEGQHTVTLEFKSPAFIAGLWSCFSALLAIAVVMVWEWRRSLGAVMRLSRRE